MTRRFYYWLTAKDDTGKPYLVFGGNSEEEARQKGFEVLGGVDFVIKRLPTRDISKASSYLKGNRLEETKSLRESGRRIGHNKSLKRFKRDNMEDLLY